MCLLDFIVSPRDTKNQDGGTSGLLTPLRVLLNLFCVQIGMVSEGSFLSRDSHVSYPECTEVRYRPTR